MREFKAETTKMFKVKMVIELVIIGVEGQGEEELSELPGITNLHDLSESLGFIIVVEEVVKE